MPVNIPDEELKRVASFRSRGRIPVSGTEEATLMWFCYTYLWAISNTKIRLSGFQGATKWSVDDKSDNNMFEDIENNSIC